MSDDYPSRIDSGPAGPPRIEALRDEEVAGVALAAIDNVRDLTGYPKDAPIPTFMGTFARHPEVFDRFMAFGMHLLYHSALEPRERELLTLRTGWLCDAPYEWGEHVSSALDHGLTREEIEKIKAGSAAAGWNECDRALLKAVDELHDQAMISDDTWEVLERYLDDRQLIELPLIVGQYHMTAFLQNSLRFVPGRDKHGEKVEKEAV